MSSNPVDRLDQIAQSYDPSDPQKSFDYWFSRLEADAVVPWLNGDSILELGGATGELASLLVDRVNSYTIVEGSSLNVETLRRRLPGVEVAEALWEDFRPDKPFSDIVLFQALEHYQSPIELLERCGTWLGPGGRIHIAVPNGNSLHRQVATAMGLQESPTAINDTDLAQGHLRNYTLETLKKDVDSAELNVLYSRGIYLKLVPNQMMIGWSEDLIRGINELAENDVENAAILFLVCERNAR